MGVILIPVARAGDSTILLNATVLPPVHHDNSGPSASLTAGVMLSSNGPSETNHAFAHLTSFLYT
jgi:hypothetical protein